LSRKDQISVLRKKTKGRQCLPTEFLVKKRMCVYVCGKTHVNWKLAGEGSQEKERREREREQAQTDRQKQTERETHTHKDRQRKETETERKKERALNV